MNRIGIAGTCLLISFVAAWAAPAVAPPPAPSRVGQRLPADQQVLTQWIDRQAQPVAEAGEAPLLPVVQELQDLIESDPVLFMLFTQMFEQVPRKPPYLNDPTGQPQIRDYPHMLRVLNQILTQAPAFNQTGLVGFPINAILDWPMGTPAGATAFLDPRVNRQLKKILNHWAAFLSSPESCAVLTDDPDTGWFSATAQEAMPTFVADFVCDPALPHYGFTSWDDFFTRTFREGRRPVANADDDAIVANACESAPYRVARNVQLRDTFWIKAQPYSLTHMLANDPWASRFEGATVYQAFLSALSYHRWHSPVSGTIVKTRLIDGSYYAEALSAGYDPAGPNDSQSYITQVAARALVFIEADNPAIGLMACLFVGMAEVSSNEITVSEGQHVEKGEQLGMFHFGGSTHCLIFRPQVQIEFDLHGQEPGPHSANIPVRARIATVAPAPAAAP
ncbi:MAG: phosphatidylserine decarboxylase family protein [Candidatus Marinimicrobia bacterium]|nr:phosphatidylserine decarboxylase family protein [Candidatus Neomarinimicrobiota bacterium]